MSTVAFSYVGIEIVAASSLEVRWPKNAERNSSDPPRHQEPASAISSTVRWSAIWIPGLVCFAYTLCGVLISFNIPRDHCDLPRFSWAPEPRCEGTQAISAFVAIAKRSGIPHLPDVFNAFLLFTALTCAMTNLYVASRSLFGLASRLNRGSSQPLVLRLLAWFGKTNRHKVPMRAMIFSSLAFAWVPFLNLADKKEGVSAPLEASACAAPGNATLCGDTGGITIFVEVLGSMGTVGVFIVWACECLAFLRFYYCLKRHRDVLEQARIPQVRRWHYEDDDYPYHSHGQPLTAYLGLLGCFILLIVCNLAYFWKKPVDESEPSYPPEHSSERLEGVFRLDPFLSNYFTIFFFLLMWSALKLFREAPWALVDLSDHNRVIQKIRNLHDLRQGSM